MGRLAAIVILVIAGVALLLWIAPVLLAAAIIGVVVAGTGHR